MDMETYRIEDSSGMIVDVGLSLDTALELCWKLAEEQEGTNDFDLGEYVEDWGGGVCPSNCDGNGWPVYRREK